MKNKIDNKLQELGFDSDDRNWILRIYDNNQNQLSDLYEYISKSGFNLEKRNDMFDFAFKQNPNYYQPVEIVDDDEFNKLVKDGIIDENGEPIEADE